MGAEVDSWEGKVGTQKPEGCSAGQSFRARSTESRQNNASFAWHQPRPAFRAGRRKRPGWPDHLSGASGGGSMGCGGSSMTPLPGKRPLVLPFSTLTQGRHGFQGGCRTASHSGEEVSFGELGTWIFPLGGLFSPARRSGRVRYRSIQAGRATRWRHDVSLHITIPVRRSPRPGSINRSSEQAAAAGAAAKA